MEIYPTVSLPYYQSPPHHPHQLFYHMNIPSFYGPVMHSYLSVCSLQSSQVISVSLSKASQAVFQCGSEDVWWPTGYHLS